MPFFTSKKDKGKEASKSAQPAYPAGAYQTQQAYPQQHPAGAAGGYGEAPPPYTPTAPQYGHPAQGYAPPQGYAPQQQYYPGAPPPQQMYGAGPYQGAPPQTVMVQGGFDADARFDGVSRPNIPPPPPGCAPNAAQMAQAQGHNVVVTQQKGSFWGGNPNDGGWNMGL